MSARTSIRDTAFALLILSSGLAAAAAPLQTPPQNDSGRRVAAQASAHQLDAGKGSLAPPAQPAPASEDSDWCLCALTVEEWIFLSQYDASASVQGSPR